jgi:hypothetical protein
MPINAMIRTPRSGKCAKHVNENRSHWTEFYLKENLVLNEEPSAICIAPRPGGGRIMLWGILAMETCIRITLPIYVLKSLSKMVWSDDVTNMLIINFILSGCSSSALCFMKSHPKFRTTAQDPRRWIGTLQDAGMIPGQLLISYALCYERTWPDELWSYGLESPTIGRIYTRLSFTSAISPSYIRFGS